MRLSTETQLFISALANAGGQLTLVDDESEFSDDATGEAVALRLVRASSYGAWDYRTEYTLTNEGRVLVGMPPVPTLGERILVILDRLVPKQASH